MIALYTNEFCEFKKKSEVKCLCGSKNIVYGKPHDDGKSDAICIDCKEKFVLDEGVRNALKSS